MAINFPGPYQLRVFYTVTPDGEAAMEHVLQINISCVEPVTPGSLFSAIEVERRVGVDVDLDAMVDGFVTLLKPQWEAADCTLDHAELWVFDEGTFDASYISSYTIGEAATGVGTTRESSQLIFSWRTFEGGAMKFYLQETQTPAGDPVAYVDMAQDVKDLVVELNWASPLPVENQRF